MQNNVPLTAEIVTKTREELVYLGAFLARGIASYTINANTPPIISAIGDRETGKSLIVETMMKSLMDERDFTDMLDENAPQAMFLESVPLAAMHNYTYTLGNISNQKALLAFDRATSPYGKHRDQDLRSAFNQHRPKECARGIIFETDDIPQPDRYSLLTITTAFNSEYTQQYLNNKQSTWNRNIDIKINDPALIQSKEFQKYWHQIANYMQDKTLIETAESANNIGIQAPINFAAP